jgi:hypothetical protein
MACLLAAAFISIAPAADAKSAGKSLKHRESVRAYALERRHRARTQRIYLPIGPSYTYYDYPYSYSRGHYPTHIGGYVYYVPRPYYSRSDYRGRKSLRRQRARRN